MSRSDVFSPEQIMKLTDNGRDIFEFELGNIPNGLFHSPLRDDKTKPSFAIYPYKGIWVFKDQGGNGDSGNAIQFIQKRYNLTFPEAIEKILIDLGLKQKRRDYQAVVSAYTRRVPIKEPVIIDWNSQSFTKQHTKYMDQYKLPENWLTSQRNIYAVKDLAVNKKKFIFEKDWYAFAYHEPKLDKCKILLLGTDTPWKWKNEVPNSHIWYLDEYEEDVCKQLWIVKSTKDSCVMDYHFGKCAVAVQNESSKIFLKNNAEKIESISKDIVVCFGSDPQGKQESIKITKERGYKWFNTPNYMYKYGIEDVSDYINEWGVESLRKQLIKKGYL